MYKERHFQSIQKEGWGDIRLMVQDGGSCTIKCLTEVMWRSLCYCDCKHNWKRVDLSVVALHLFPYNRIARSLQCFLWRLSITVVKLKLGHLSHIKLTSLLFGRHNIPLINKWISVKGVHFLETLEKCVYTYIYIDTHKERSGRDCKWMKDSRLIVVELSWDLALELFLGLFIDYCFKKCIKMMKTGIRT